MPPWHYINFTMCVWFACLWHCIISLHSSLVIFFGGQPFVSKVAIASQDSKPIAHHGQGVQAHEGFHEGHQEGASHELPRDHAR